MFYIEVTRKKESWDYKYDKSKNTFQNNIKNNLIDLIRIKNSEGNLTEFLGNCQTVGNHPSQYLSDSLAEGEFDVKLWVVNTGFRDPVHGIIGAKTISGLVVDKNSMNNDKGRWLLHSTWYIPLNKETAAYSGGCIIQNCSDFAQFNKKLEQLGFKAGDIIKCKLIEEK